MKMLDPSIVLILCGENGTTSWDYYVLNQCIKWESVTIKSGNGRPLIDMHSIHIYTAAGEHLKNVTGGRRLSLEEHIIVDTA
jgi:alpha-L-arabinofuranosidase